LEKCAKLKETRHTWKNAPPLRKWSTLGKVRHTYENPGHFKKNAPHLRKGTTLGKMRST